MLSFKFSCETYQCPIIISSKRRRRRDQAASVIARRPLIAAAGDVRTAPRLGCCRGSGGNGGSGNAVVATPAAAQPKPSHLSFFLSLLASSSLCVQKLCLVGGVQLTFLPCSLSPVPSLRPRLPTSLFPLHFLLFCCSSTLFLLLFLPLPILPPLCPTDGMRSSILPVWESWFITLGVTGLFHAARGCALHYHYGADAPRRRRRSARSPSGRRSRREKRAFKRKAI